MRRLVKSVYTPKLYAIFLSITLFISCENWNLPTVRNSLTDGLVAYYPFNGNTLDESGNGLNGQPINGATYGTDRKEASQSALFLDGIDDYVEIPDNNKLRPDSISISLWIKARKVTETSHIYNKSNFSDHQNQQYSAFIRPPRPPNTGTACCEIIMDVNTDGLCTVEQPIQNPVIHYAPTYEMNQWYHLVTVFAGQTNKLYINGVLKMSQKEITTNPVDRCAGGNLRFGAQASYDANYFNGTMDEIRIYNRSLSETEINALYKR
jgi:hypothetical protein